MQLTGFHHLTAITANASQNHEFYTSILGMRLVKKTVNQDDTSAYHLFYADGKANPGTDITFFDWPAMKEKRGTNSIVRTGLRVSSEAALTWWQERFKEQGIVHEDIKEINKTPTLNFEDPEGQRLALVVDSSARTDGLWDKSTVPAEYQIRGLGPITLSVPDLAPTDKILTHVLAMEQTYIFNDNTYVYQMLGGGPATELHVRVEKDLPRAHQGAGAVHHVAFRTPTVEEYHEWDKKLSSMRLAYSGPIDRFYFKSLYLREPNDILFEIATDEPGFTVDEPLASVGEKLSLPPFLEGKRESIEARLKPL